MRALCRRLAASTRGAFIEAGFVLHNPQKLHKSYFSSLIDRFQSVLLILEKGIIFLPIGYPISLFLCCTHSTKIT